MKVKDAIVVATQYVNIPHTHLKGPGALTSSFAPFERAGRDILAQQIDDLSQSYVRADNFPLRWLYH